MAKVLYVFGVVTLVIFHLELFTGGYFCKQLFGVRRWPYLPAPSPATLL